MIDKEIVHREEPKAKPIPTAGAAFSPHRLFYGAVLPAAIMKHPKLTPAAVVVWARLSWYCGTSDSCFPKLPELAKETNLSPAKLVRALKLLEVAGLLKSQQRGPGREALRTLLWQPDLEPSLRAKLSHQCESNDAKLSHQCEASFRKSDAKLSHQCEGTYKEEENQEKDQGRESSSIEEPVVEPEPTTKGAIATDSEPGPAGPWWTAEQLEQARRMLADHRRKPPPDADLVRDLFGMVEGWAQFLTWFRPLELRVSWRTVESYGLYKFDLAKWRKNPPAIVEPIRAADPVDEPEPAIETAAEEPIAPVKPTMPRCPHCSGLGWIDAEPSARWCQCERADKRRAGEPDLVEERNRVKQRLREWQQRAPKPTAATENRPKPNPRTKPTMPTAGAIAVSMGLLRRVEAAA